MKNAIQTPQVNGTKNNHNKNSTHKSKRVSDHTLMSQARALKRLYLFNTTITWPEYIFYKMHNVDLGITSPKDAYRVINFFVSALNQVDNKLASYVEQEALSRRKLQEVKTQYEQLTSIDNAEEEIQQNKFNQTIQDAMTGELNTSIEKQTVDGHLAKQSIIEARKDTLTKEKELETEKKDLLDSQNDSYQQETENIIRRYCHHQIKKEPMKVKSYTRSLFDYLNFFKTNNS